MMKLEIWTGPEVKEETPTRVRLFRGVRGNIDLRVVDVNGDCVLSGVIATLSGAGLDRQYGLSRDFGFPIDERGRIADI